MVAAVLASKRRRIASSQPDPDSYTRNPMYLGHLI
jgi:hypothetical protein